MATGISAQCATSVAPLSLLLVEPGAAAAWVFLEGDQFAFPTSAAMAGTVTVRTTKVSIKRPMPMMNPVCVIVDRLPNNRPNIEAAKLSRPR